MKEYERAKKPRHIVNGHAFKEPYEALDYIKNQGWRLERIEVILNISIYHIAVS